MEILVQANLLMVGLNERTRILDELPVRLINADSAVDAVRCIRNEKFDMVISKWELPDLADGMFFKRLRMVKPDMTSLVLVDGDDPQQEIMARSVGVSAVLTEDCGDDLLLATVAGIFGIEVPVNVHSKAKERTVSVAAVKQ